MTFAEMVAAELARATAKNGKFNSAHEGYAVLLEEVEELWLQVKLKPRERDRDNMLTECVQIAAMAQRFAMDVLGFVPPTLPDIDTTKLGGLMIAPRAYARAYDPTDDRPVVRFDPSVTMRGGRAD